MPCPYAPREGCSQQRNRERARTRAPTPRVTDLSQFSIPPCLHHGGWVRSNSGRQSRHPRSALQQPVAGCCLWEPQLGSRDAGRPRRAMQSATGAGTFLLELLKPSHYDDDGYVIQWWRGSVPSNSLSSLYGLACDAQRRHVLGDDVALEIAVRDETTAVLPLQRIIRRFRRNRLRGLVCLVGVQTNQFPRALDIARQLRAAGIQVAIGGFHVSGCLAMLPELPADLREAQRARRLSVRRRGRRALGRAPARRRRPAARPALQLHEGPSRVWNAAAAVPAAQPRAALSRQRRQLRRRPRLPVHVQLLHDHQRAGAQVALPDRRRRRAT